MNRRAFVFDGGVTVLVKPRGKTVERIEICNVVAAIARTWNDEWGWGWMEIEGECVGAPFSFAVKTKDFMGATPTFRAKLKAAAGRQAVIHTDNTALLRKSILERTRLRMKGER